VLDLLKTHVAAVSGRDPARWTGSTRLTELALDSPTLVELSRRLGESLGLECGERDLLALDSFHAIGHELTWRNSSRAGAVPAPANTRGRAEEAATAGDHAQERLLAAGETALAIPGTPMVISQVLSPALDTDALARAVTALSALHPVLAARIEATDHGMVLRRSRTWPAPALQKYSGPRSGDEPFPIGEPLLRAILVPEAAGGHRFTLVVSHVVGDGTSMAALWSTLWEIYEADTAGRTPDLPPPGSGLPQPVQEYYTHRFTEQDITAYLAQRSAQTDGRSPAVITPLAAHPGGGPGPETGAHRGRTVVNARQTARLEHTARQAGTTLHALLCGVALAAVRTQIDVQDRPAVMTCASPVDVRTRVRPPIPAHRLVMAVAVPQFIVEAGPAPDPAVLAHVIGQQMRTAAESGDVDRAFAAMPQLLADTTAAMPPTLIVSSVLGRTPAHAPVGDGPLDAYAYAPGPAPAVYVQSLPDKGLALSVVMPCAWFTTAQCHQLTEALTDALARVLGST
jgi:hypothetical protein